MVASVGELGTTSWNNLSGTALGPARYSRTTWCLYNWGVNANCKTREVVFRVPFISTGTQGNKAWQLEIFPNVSKYLMALETHHCHVYYKQTNCLDRLTDRQTYRQTDMGTLAVQIKLNGVSFFPDLSTSLVVIATDGLLLLHMELRPVQCFPY